MSLFRRSLSPHTTMKISLSALAILIQGIAAQIAFPGAEGLGRNAVGGRYGSVYKVTNLK